MAYDVGKSSSSTVVAFRVGVAVALLMITTAGALPAEEAKQPSSASLTPEQVVTHYLEALKAEKFGDAYGYMTKGMTQGKSRDEWAKEQQWTMQMSDAKIFEFHVYPGKLDGDKAHVPNLLSSQDKFLNQLGVPEHELYTLVRENGSWKIDQQQLLEHSEQGKWFPSQPQTK